MDHRSAPTGRHRSAQGNALGFHAPVAQTLKGWNNLVPPFQGLPCVEPHDSQGVALGCHGVPFQGEGENAHLQAVARPRNVYQAHLHCHGPDKIVELSAILHFLVRWVMLEC